MKDEAIIQGIVSGDSEAIAGCMRQYGRLLWTVSSAVLKKVGSDQDVEECVADAFIYLWQNPDAFDPGRGKLKSWLCLVARSRSIDRYRSLLGRQTVPLEETLLADALGMQDALLRKETQLELRDALAALDDTGREILLRRYYQEQKPREIASAMGISVKQVDNSLYRSKGCLRRILTGKQGGKL